MTKDTIDRSVRELTEKSKQVYGSLLKAVILYGSCARGDFSDDSDIDVMILIDTPPEKIQDERIKMLDIVKQIDRDFDFEILLAPVIQSYMVYAKYVDAMPYYRNIEKEGIRYA